MGGGERMTPCLRDSPGLRRKHDQSEAANESEILEELPEVLQPLSFAKAPHIGEAPELVKQHRGEHAKTREQERRESIVPAGHDARRCAEFNQDREYEHRTRPRHAAGLFQGRCPIENLIEAAERKQHHQANAQHQRGVVVDERHGGAVSFEGMRRKSSGVHP